MTQTTIDTNELIAAIENDLDREYRYQMAVRAYLERYRKRKRLRLRIRSTQDAYYGVGCILLAVASALLLRFF